MSARYPAWSPSGFDEWRQHYPLTPFEPAPTALDWTERFIECWHAHDAHASSNIVIVLIAGLYSEWIPACFRHAALALRAARYSILRVPVRSSRAVAEQGAHIVRNLYARLPADRRFIVLAHSKGGLDALAALHADSGLRARCDGIALVQPPVGPSAIIDGLLEQGGGARRSRMGGWSRREIAAHTLVVCRLARYWQRARRRHRESVVYGARWPALCACRKLVDRTHVPVRCTSLTPRPLPSRLCA